MPAPVAAAYFHDEIVRELEAQGDANAPYPAVTVVASHEGQVGRASHFRSALQRLSGASVELAVLSKNKLNPGETHYTPTLVGKFLIGGYVLGRIEYHHFVGIHQTVAA